MAGLGALAVTGGSWSLFGACTTAQPGSDTLAADPETAALVDSIVRYRHPFARGGLQRTGQGHLRPGGAHLLGAHDGGMSVLLERRARDPAGAG